MFTIKNSKGETVSLIRDGKLIPEREFMALMNEKYSGQHNGWRLQNANGDIDVTSLGFNYTTDRLTYIRAKYVEQTFYEIAPGDYMDVIEGEGAFSGDIITNLSIKTGPNFRSGKLNQAGHNSRVPVADASVVPFHTYVMNWALAIEFNLFEVRQAAFAGNWDPVENKHKARKKDFDLGIQEVSFLGDVDNLTSFPGLYTLPNVNSNLTVITKKISDMNAAEFATFAGAFIAAFLTNAQQAVWPNQWLMPQDDYAGLGAPVSSTMPLISKRKYLEDMVAGIVPGGKFKILPCAYGLPSINKKAGLGSGSGLTRHVLMRRDVDTVFLELPVPYQTTQVGTLNNFQFQDVAYAQYTGASNLKPREILYFDF